MPNHPQLLKIIERVGPIYSSSANISGEEPINNHLEAIKKFEKFANKLIIVEGKKISNLPSTIYSFDTKKEIRKGNININVIMKK
jgi:L-threonylcarbamoyladenylate synthase